MSGLKTDAEFVLREGLQETRTLEELKERLVKYFEDDTHRKNKLKRDYEKVDLEATVTQIVRRSSSGGGGGSSSVAIVFGQSQAVTAGANTIPIPASMRTGTVDYIVSAVLVGSDGAQTLGQPETKAVNSFSYSDLVVAGTLYFDIKAKA